MQTEVLGFVFTEKCNFRCRHCCNESGPDGVTTMDVEEIVRHVRSAAALGRFREVGISGGEPFLFPRQLLRLVEAAHACGLGAAVTTNAFWARTPQRAQAVLAPLVQAGLRAVSVSVSRFHLEFARQGTHLTAVRAALDLGLQTRLNVVTSAGFGRAEAAGLLADLGERAGEVELVVMSCLPTGRAAQLVPADERPGQARRFGNCAGHFTKVAVTAGGDVYPCCSPGGFTPPLLLGNLRDQALGDLLRAMDDSPLLQVLAGVGPAFFVPFVERALGHRLALEQFEDQCHLCHALLSDAQLREVVDDALDQLRRELAELDLTLTELTHLEPAAGALAAPA